MHDDQSSPSSIHIAILHYMTLMSSTEENNLGFPLGEGPVGGIPAGNVTRPGS